eukprot:TRINITY_DN6259_c0_g1_i5.p1 TRINITY_DN6259_c0_g1~~TRINITY_DN6259_c0_g1_i5.p1  ORF type:complete len:212 (+),score=55.27 TRINITY_DN6259_c0_g1_i5:162-797(+)
MEEAAEQAPIEQQSGHEQHKQKKKKTKELEEQELEEQERRRELEEQEKGMEEVKKKKKKRSKEVVVDNSGMETNDNEDSKHEHKYWRHLQEDMDVEPGCASVSVLGKRGPLDEAEPQPKRNKPLLQTHKLRPSQTHELHPSQTNELHPAQLTVSSEPDTSAPAAEVLALQLHLETITAKHEAAKQAKLLEIAQLHEAISQMKTRIRLCASA